MKLGGIRNCQKIILTIPKIKIYDFRTLYVLGQKGYELNHSTHQRCDRKNA